MKLYLLVIGFRYWCRYVLWKTHLIEESKRPCCNVLNWERIEHGYLEILDVNNLLLLTPINILHLHSLPRQPSMNVKIYNLEYILNYIFQVIAKNLLNLCWNWYKLERIPLGVIYKFICYHIRFYFYGDQSSLTLVCDNISSK